MTVQDNYDGSSRFIICQNVVIYQGPIRDRMVFQERRVHRLREQVESMMEANRRCDEVRRRQEAFLGHLIEKYQGDNVPLTAELCKQYCALFEVSPSIWRRIYIGSFPASSSSRYPLWSAATFKFSVISKAAVIN